MTKQLGSMKKLGASAGSRRLALSLSVLLAPAPEVAVECAVEHESAQLQGPFPTVTLVAKSFSGGLARRSGACWTGFRIRPLALVR
jgi:hypothetical protein